MFFIIISLYGVFPSHRARFGSNAYRHDDCIHFSWIANFINKPFMKQAVEIRRFDDQAKIENFQVKDLSFYVPYMEAFVK